MSGIDDTIAAPDATPGPTVVVTSSAQRLAEIEPLQYRGGRR